MDNQASWRAMVIAAGEANARNMLKHPAGYNAQHLAEAQRWIDELDANAAAVREADRRAEVSDSNSIARDRNRLAAESNSIDRQARDTAKKALRVAIASLIVSAVLAIAGIWVVHRDTARPTPTAATTATISTTKPSGAP